MNLENAVGSGRYAQDAGLKRFVSTARSTDEVQLGSRKTA